MANYDGITSPIVQVQFAKSGTWTPVPADDLLTTTIRRGRSRQDQRDASGTATVQFNNSTGYYDPDYTGSDSPWVVSGESILKTGLPMQVVAIYDDYSYTIYSGFLDNNVVNQGNIPLVTMQFVDGITKISEGWATNLADYDYALEPVNDRVNRMLDYAGWDSGYRSISGTIPLGYTSQGKSCIRMIHDCIDAVAGRFYISIDGYATFVTLDDKFTRPTRMLFSDKGAEYSAKYDAIVTNDGSQYVINNAVISNLYSQQYSSTYNPSVDTYKVKAYSAQIPTAGDDNSLALALYYSRYKATPETYVEAIQFSALDLGELYPDFLQMELGDQVSVQRTTYDGRDLQWNLVVEGQTHSITKNNWLVSLTTSPINPYTVEFNYYA